MSPEENSLSEIAEQLSIKETADQILPLDAGIAHCCVLVTTFEMNPLAPKRTLK